MVDAAARTFDCVCCAGEPRISIVSTTMKPDAFTTPETTARVPFSMPGSGMPMSMMLRRPPSANIV
jgi:hypothetical protein